VSASFPQGGAPELSISGYDNVFPLTIGKSSETWANDHDSRVVQQIAGQRHLAVEAEQTKEARPQIEQNQESDFEFIRKLAQRNYYKVYVEEGAKASVLRFAPPNDKSGPVVRLVWGAGLLSFRPSANLAGQVGAAEVYGWDPKKADRFLGQAGRGDLTDLAGNQRSAGELLARIVGEKQPTLRIRQPVYSESEANTRAQAALNENEEEFLTGDGESIGLPEIRPDQNLELAGLGTPFSRTWYVEQATHRVDSGGYRTSFRVKHKLIPASKK
jgi:phage protein D